MDYDFALERETKAALLIKQAIELAGQSGDDDLLLGCIEGETNLFEQIDGLLIRGADLAAMAGALDDQIKDLQARKQRFKNGEDTIRRLLFGVMQIVGLQKLERALATLSVRAGSKRVSVDDEKLIPPQFFKTEKSVILTDVKKAIDAGEAVPGASIVTGDATLMIKRT